MDARPLQDPDRAPLTSLYLRGLLSAFDAEPLDGESFALLLQSDLDDPTGAFGRLEIVGRRLLPPTRFLRSGAMTVDPILLARRLPRGGLGCGPRRCGRSALSRRRCGPAAHRARACPSS